MNKKKITDLHFDKQNINKGSEFGNSLLEKSLREGGAGRSILIDKNGVIIAGNQTAAKAGELGIEDVIIVQSDGKSLIAVQRTDIDINTPEGAKLKILDNTVSKHNYVEDAEVMEAVCEEYELEPADLGLQVAKEVDAKEDDFNEEPPAIPKTVLGDLYELNNHRLQCGDSCDADVVAKTLNGKKVNIMVTDPPYGVKLDQTWRNGVGSQNHNGNSNIVLNDDIADWTDAYALFTGTIAYVWHATKFTDVIMKNLRDCKFEPNQMLILNKSVMVMGRSDYHWKHEPCWYAVKKGENHSWIGDRKQVTVIDAVMPSARAQKSDEDRTDHPTQKPVTCMSIPISNHSGDVYDPFMGSGTTLIASEQLGRKCYGQELDPAYVDIDVRRWVKYMKENNKPYSVKRNGIDITNDEWLNEQH